jgi:hypothetical protein
MALEVGLTKHHFHRLFKRETGQTPKEYAIASRNVSSVSSAGTPSTGTSTPSCVLEWQTAVEDLAFDTSFGPSDFVSSIFYDLIGTRYGLLLVAFHEEQISKLELCVNEEEAYDLLYLAFPSQLFTCTRLSDESPYEGIITRIIEALERPSGKYINISTALIAAPG